MTNIKTITKEEWEKIHKDYKGIDKDGIHRILKFIDGIGTCSVPVKIVKK